MFNNYGPYMYQAPGKFNFSNIINGATKTLNVINQAIPIIKEVKPVLKNARSIIKIVNGLKIDSIKVEQNKKEKDTNYNTGPNFFI